MKRFILIALSLLWARAATAASTIIVDGLSFPKIPSGLGFAS